MLIKKKCAVQGCENTSRSNHICIMHESRLRRHGDLNKITRRSPGSPSLTCPIPGCNRIVYSNGLCHPHRMKEYHKQEKLNPNKTKRQPFIPHLSNKICRQCKQTFAYYIQFPSHSNKVFCSKICWHSVNKGKPPIWVIRKQQNPDPPKYKTCLRCSKQFIIPKNQPQKKYCTRFCGHRRNGKEVPYKKTCIRCSNQFKVTRTHPSQIYCKGGTCS